MRYVIGLFDAPVPARAGLAALAAAGFAPDDILVVPTLPSPPDAPLPTYAAVPAEGAADLAGALMARGMPAPEAQDYAEAVARGAILVVVRAPTLSAPAATGALSGAGVADLDTHRARWHADASLRYRWADTPPPELGTDSSPDPGYEPGPEAG